MNTLQDHADKEHELAGKITRVLNQGTCGIESQTAEKLLAARKQALSLYKDEQPAMQWLPVWAGAAARFAEPYSQNARAWIAILALATSMAGALSWQMLNSPGGSEIAEIDSGLLTDELPITAYIDSGFDSWLKRP